MRARGPLAAVAMGWLLLACNLLVGIDDLPTGAAPDGAVHADATAQDGPVGAEPGPEGGDATTGDSSAADSTVSDSSAPDASLADSTSPSDAADAADASDGDAADGSDASLTVTGTITGLAGGASVVLQDSAGDQLTVSSNGTFTFPLADGGAYPISVLTQPTTSPAALCTVDNGDGTATVSCDTIVSVGTGYVSTCVVLSRGSVACWGDNTAATLGDETFVNSDTPVAVPGLFDAVQVVVGLAHACALSATGQVYCWGNNGSGQLGNSNPATATHPVSVPGLAAVSAVAAGAYHTCALVADGGVVECWGDNAYGGLGDGTLASTSAPTKVSASQGDAGLAGVTAIAAGGYHTCALLGDGGVDCWGLDTSGQLGNGSLTSSTTPVSVAGLSGVTAIAAGSAHSCAVIGAGDSSAGGTLECWGNNSTGALGIGSVVTMSTPQLVVLHAPALEVTCGSSFTCARLVGGAVDCWGENVWGEVGNGGTTQETSPVAVPGAAGATLVAAGDIHACALLASGLECWGGDDYGQLGNGVATQVNTPTAVPGIGAVTLLSAYNDQSCALIDGGTAACWGRNTFGTIGNGSVATASTPSTVDGLTGAVQVTTGGFHSCAVLADGGLDCWGYNAYGELGNGTLTQALVPVPVSLGDAGAATAVAVGPYATCAIVGGGVSCWGQNASGQIGNGTTTNASTPVPVPGLTGVTSISVGDAHTCAVSDGGVSCWGLNNFGQLGRGPVSNTPYLSPVPVPGLSNVKAVIAGYAHTCALMADGGVDCWGDNANGQVGNGTFGPDVLAPTPVQSLPSAVAVAAGSSHTCALLTDGGVDCWGDGEYGQVGNGTTAPEVTTPTPAALSGSAIGVVAGANHSCALFASGDVQCWGWDGFGQLGLGLTTQVDAPAPVE